jgi:hypothetical protein
MDFINRSQWVRQRSDYVAFIPRKLPPDPPLLIDDKMIRLLSDISVTILKNIEPSTMIV